MDEIPQLCPQCGQFGLMAIRAAEVPTPLMYGCSLCTRVLTVEDYVAAMLERAGEPEPEKPTIRERMLRAVRRSA